MASGGGPDASTSTVNVSATNFPVESDIEVHINLRGRAGDPVNDPRAISTVDSIVETPRGHTLRLNFAANCVAKFVVHDVGKHKIHVKIGGADVKCSPVSVLATPRDNLIATHKPPLNQPHDIIPHGNEFVVTNKGSNEVIIVDSEFRLANKFCSPEMPGMGKFDPYAVACTGDTFVVTDLANHCVVEFKNLVPYQVFGQETLDTPCGIVATKNGNVYVADCAKHCIFVFDKHRECVSIMGGQGSALGQLDGPWFMAMNSKGNIFVAEFKNRRVQVWNPRNNNAVRIINVDHGGKKWDCRGIAVDHNDNVYVTVRSGFMRGWSVETVLVYARSGEYLGKFGEKFNYVRGMTVTQEGNKTIAYVVDGGNYVIKAYEM